MIYDLHKLNGIEFKGIFVMQNPISILKQWMVVEKKEQVSKSLMMAMVQWSITRRIWN